MIVFGKVIKYNSLDKVSSKSVLGAHTNYSYDTFGRLTTEKITQLIQNSNASRPLTTLNYNYINNRLSSLKPLISEVQYDSFGNVQSIDFSRGLRLMITRPNDGSKITSFSYRFKGESLWNKSYEYNRANHVKKIITRSKIRESQIDDIKYSSSLQLIKERSNVKRDSLGRVKEIENTNFSWNDDNLEEVRFIENESKVKKSINNFFDSSGSLIASCPSNIKLDSAREECFYRTGEDEVFYEGSLVKRIRVEGIPVAILIENKLLPVAVDSLGSITAVFSVDGKHIIFERRFDEWGKKSVTFNYEGWWPQLSADVKKEVANYIEKATVWSYAGLIENPLYRNESVNLYWSQTRAYSPDIKEWLSIDPKIKWNPNSLVNQPGNWHSVRYAGNNPVNFVDPSGQFTQRIWQQYNSIGVGKQFYSEMRAAGKAMLDATMYAGAAIGVIAAGSAVPALANAVAPKIAAYSIAATIEYNVAAISVGQFVAKNPTLIENAIVNTIDFVDSFSGVLDGPTTGLPPTTAGGAYGYGAGYLLDKAIDYSSTSDSFSEIFSNIWWNK